VAGLGFVEGWGQPIALAKAGGLVGSAAATGSGEGAARLYSFNSSDCSTQWVNVSLPFAVDRVTVALPLTLFASDGDSLSDVLLDDGDRSADAGNPTPFVAGGRVMGSLMFFV
jgi:hypothetical protein